MKNNGTILDLDRVVFRSPRVGDTNEMANFFNRISAEKTYIRYQGMQISLEDEEKYLQDLLKKLASDQAICVQAWLDDELIGSADIKRQIESEAHVGVFGIIVKKEYRGLGLGKELMKRCLQQAKEVGGLEIITLSVQAKNEIAKKLYVQLGFIEYGCLPKGVIRRGQHDDHIYMYLNLG